MLTIIIFIIIGIPISLYLTKRIWKRKNKVDKTTRNINGFMGGVFGGIFGLFIAIIITGTSPIKTYDQIKSYNIEALQDNSGLNGRFFLGSGSIEGRIIYSIYYEENEFYKLIQLNPSRVKIKYSNNQPKLHIIQEYQVDEFMNDFKINVFHYSNKRYIIEIPRGTIINNYYLDAK